MTKSRTHIIRSLLLIGMMAGSVQILSAQISLPYYVDFNTAIPSDWQNAPSDTIFWEFVADQGDPTPGAAVVDLGYTSGQGISTLVLPALDLTSVPNPILRFRLAVVTSNFVGPALVLSYDNGNGPQLFDTWGEYHRINFDTVNHRIPASFNHTRSLDSNRVVWSEITVDLSSLVGEENITFMFQAEFSNGGWVLLDDVAFANGTVTSVQSRDEASRKMSLALYPNPTTTTLMIEAEDGLDGFSGAEIINALGQTVSVVEIGGNSQQRIDVAHLAPGRYWVRLTDSQGTVVTESFVKMDGE